MVYKWYSQLHNYRVPNNTPINQLQLAFSIWSSGLAINKALFFAGERTNLNHRWVTVKSNNMRGEGLAINKALEVGENLYKTFLSLFLW
jgi:hypothetical protein